MPCILQKNGISLTYLFQFAELDKLLMQGLVKNKNEKIRKSIESTFKVLCTYFDSSLIQNPKEFILSILLKNLPQTKGRLKHLEHESFEEFFGLLSSLIKVSNSEAFEGIRVLS